MTVRYNINDYIKGINGFGNQFCDINYSAKLAANTHEEVTVPGSAPMGGLGSTVNAFVAVITSDTAGVFVARNATAIVPAGGTFGATTSCLLPTGEPFCRVVFFGDTLSFVATSDNSNVCVEFFAASV